MQSRDKQLKDKERRIFMYGTITNAKDAIKLINKVYPILEKIFNGRPTMTRKEIMAIYSSKEKVKRSSYYGYYTERVLPCFETLRHLGLLVVVKEEKDHMYSVEDDYGDKNNIPSSVYETLPKVFKNMCEETNFLRYHYELTPKEIAIEKIIETVRNNFDSLMKLAN